MCTGACSKFIAVPLYVLALVSIICNIMLFFPDFETSYAATDRKGTDRITEEVKYMGGVIGGGIMVLIPAIHIHLTSANKCCANRCGMFLSIGFAAAGVVGALYSLSVASVGLVNGPLCYWSNAQNPIPRWGTPFSNRCNSIFLFISALRTGISNTFNCIAVMFLCLTTQLLFILFSNGSYLDNRDMWEWCWLPENVVEFNVALFSTLLVAAIVELVLCLIQMVNGLCGCICGTCSSKDVRPEQPSNIHTAHCIEIAKLFLPLLKRHH
uniref:Uncharacterized protein n=1 Tax=Amphiprion ocellaris TaxID=80972 RepID=A0AAQ5X5I9_AMPOC